MDQEPAPPPRESDGRPGIFHNINSTVAGITGLVVALGGLAAATRGVVWDKEDRAEQPAPAPAQQAASAAPAPDAAADAEPEAGDPTSYKGETVEGGKLLSIAWDGESWVVTEGDNDPWSYDDTLSPDETRVMAVSNGNYLRWPIAGGEVDESEDKVKWKTYARVEAQNAAK